MECIPRFSYAAQQDPNISVRTDTWRERHKALSSGYDSGGVSPLSEAHYLPLPLRVLRGGCADGVTSGCAVGAVPLEDGDHESSHRPEQERGVTEQGICQITHLRMRSQWLKEREIPLK